MSGLAPWLLAGKALCVVLYAAALARLAGWLPDGVFPYAPWIAAVFLVFHAIEVPIFWRRVTKYRGPLAVSIALTVLFGLLHLTQLRGASADTAASAR
jgi:uncharacterized protein YhhL (DUF1145 family)